MAKRPGKLGKSPLGGQLQYTEVPLGFLSANAADDGGGKGKGKGKGDGGGSSSSSSSSSYSSGASGYSSYSGGGSSGGGGGGGAAAPEPDLSTRSEARAILWAGLSSILGRKPTSKEVDAYLHVLNKYETKKGPGKEAMSAAQSELFTQDFINDDPDTKAERRGYEAATKYFDAFTKAIQSPVNI